MSILRKQHKTLSAIPTARWSAYAAAGAASVLGVASSAEATIHVVNVNETFSAPDFGSVMRTFSLGKSANLELTHSRFSTVGRAFFGVAAGTGPSHNVGINGVANSSGHYVSKLAAGASIAKLAFFGPPTSRTRAVTSGTLAVGRGYGGSQWLAKGQGYVGFEFNTGAGEQYGWASLTMDGAPINSFTLNAYAYGDPGDIVTAGETTLPAVPEPGSLVLLALGGAGLLAWRKRRALAAAQPTLPA